mgnify:CR=1 FL=1
MLYVSGVLQQVAGNTTDMAALIAVLDSVVCAKEFANNTKLQQICDAVVKDIVDALPWVVCTCRTVVTSSKRPSISLRELFARVPQERGGSGTTVLTIGCDPLSGQAGSVGGVAGAKRSLQRHYTHLQRTVLRHQHHP